MNKYGPYIQSLLLASVPALIAFSVFWKIDTTPSFADAKATVDTVKVRDRGDLRAFMVDFEAKLDSAHKLYGVPGAAVSIVIDSTFSYVRTFGVKSLERPDPINQSTTFRIASLSKGFAAILAGKMLKTKNTGWDTPLSRYAPDFTTTPDIFKDSITLEHILSHTAGYPYQAYSTLVEEGLPRDEILTQLHTITLSEKPGERYSYQNVAYSLIEPVLEYHYDTTYQGVIHKELFKPLGMRNASITYETIAGSQNRAQPHMYRKKRLEPIALSPAYYNVAAAGGINASITDMTQWIRALLGQRQEIVPASVLEEVFTPRVETSVKNYAFRQFDEPRKGNYGLGWRIVEYPADTLIYHGGYANGFKSEIALDRDKNIAICILTNAPSQFCNVMVVEFFREYKKFLSQNNNNESLAMP